MITAFRYAQWPQWLAIGALLLHGCSKPERQAAEIPVQGAAKNGSATWHVFVPNPSHVVMLEAEANSTVAYRAVVADLGEASLPAGLNVPAKYDAVVLNEGKTEAECAAPGGARWLYKIGAATSTSPDIVIGIIGLSELHDPDGWSIEAAASFGAGTAWDLIYRSRVRNPGPAPEPNGICQAGGIGATSCSITTGNGPGCSAGCGGGYHACCNIVNGTTLCQCVKD